MAITINGKIYRNLQEQVLKNQDDIVELIDGVSNITGAITNEIGEVVEQVSELNQEIAKALKTPMAAPAATKLVAVDTSNDQALVSIGEGLTLENNTLSASGGSGGSGKYLHVLNMEFEHEYYLNPRVYATVNVVLNTPEDMSFAWAGSEGETNDAKYEALAKALVAVGITENTCLSFMASHNYSLSIKPAQTPSPYWGVSNLIIENYTDGEQIYANNMGVSDTVIPL